MISTTVADRGATTERVALIAASLVSFEIAVIRKAAEPKHLPPLRNDDACLPGFGLAGLQNTLRHRVALEQLGVAGELLGGQSFLRNGLQVVALLRHEARTLHDDERLAGVDPVPARDRKAGHHAGYGTAHDPQLRRGDYDLGGIGQRLVGWARNRMNDANAQACCLLGAEFHRILGQRHGWETNQGKCKRGSKLAPPRAPT